MSDLAAVVEALGRGELVGLPTDTVYGVGCDAFDQQAVRSLFGLKDRPAVKPIPILIGNFDDATFPKGATWGPLTGIPRFGPGSAPP